MQKLYIIIVDVLSINIIHKLKAYLEMERNLSRATASMVNKEAVRKIWANGRSQGTSPGSTFH